MRLLKVLGVYALLSAVLGGLLLFQAFPARPETPTGWILLFALALPITLVGEWVGDKLLNNRLGRHVDETTRNRRVSIVRILFALGVSLAAMALIVVLYRLFQNL